MTDVECKLFIDNLKKYIDNKKSITGIEIGVLNGESANQILNIDKRILLIGIDPIIPDSIEKTLVGDIEKINKTLEPYKNRWTFYNDYSYKVNNKFIDASIDFIFIDGSHIYEDVKQDYELYISKIKEGGLLFFHDSRMNREGANFHIGSSKLVDELIKIDNSISLIGEAFSLTCFKKI